jgi:hypothetical protein
MVRKNATTFSDQEIADQFHCSESDEKVMCCPVSASKKGSAACSCG